MLLLNVEMPSSGCKPSLQAVQPFSTEAAAILSYLYEGMPEDTELCQIERWECQLLFLPYHSGLQGDSADGAGMEVGKIGGMAIHLWDRYRAEHKLSRKH